ncbi:MAG: hypothetical protein L0Z62_44490 [Gemmataceae bacterium]|nr:hypothetical protein [Gemmataceae bacterium]
MPSSRGSVLVLAGLVLFTGVPCAGEKVAPMAGPIRTDRHGDPLPERAVARLGGSQLRHEILTGSESCFAFSPDGQILASCNRSTIRLWDCRTGKLLREIPRPANEYPDTLRFAPDGQHVVAVFERIEGVRRAPGVVRFLNVRTGKPKYEWQAGGTAGGSAPHLLAFAPDGSLVTATLDGEIQFRAAATGTIRRRLLGPEWLLNFGLSRDGRTLLALYRDKVIRWDTTTGKRLGERSFPQPRWGRIAYPADFSLLALHPLGGKGVVFWDPVTGKEKGRLQDPELIVRGGMTFTPDGRSLLTVHEANQASATEAKWWDVASGKLLRSVSIPPRATSPPIFAPDGKTLIFPSFSPAIVFWDAATWKPRLTPQGHQDSLSAVTFTPDGKTVLTGSNDRIQAWDAASGKPLHTLEGRWSGPQVLALDGRTLLVAKGYKAGPGLYDLPTGKLLRALPVVGPKPAYVRLVQPSADGRQLVGITEVELKAKLHVWDLAKGKEVESRVLGPAEPYDALLGGGAWLAGVARNPPEEMPVKDDLAGPALPAWLVVKDWRRGRELLRVRLPGDWGFELTGSRDERTLATLASVPAVKGQRDEVSILQLWEMASGEARLEIRRPARWDTYFSRLARSPDGRTLATVWGYRTVELWDAFTGRLLLSRTADAQVQCLAFAPDGRTLATGLMDGTALLWDVQAVTGRPTPARRLSDREAEACWAQLARDARQAYVALGQLIADPERAVALLRERVKPAEPVSADRVKKLIAALGAPTYRERESAMRELRALGEQTEAALQAALAKKPPEETRRRVEQLLAAVWRDRSPEALRRLRVVEALEWVGTPAARQALEGLAGGAPGATLTRAAAGALQRLRQGTAAP